MQKSAYSTEIMTVFCMCDLRGRKCVQADLHYSVFWTWAWAQFHGHEAESADKTFRDQAVFQEDRLLALLVCVCMCACVWRPAASWRCKTLHQQSLYWPEGPEDGTLSSSLVVHWVIILTADSNKMLMRLFSFLPSCLYSPYNTKREPRDSTANIACHYDIAISIIRKHQAAAPG